MATLYRLEQEQRVPLPLGRAFEFYADALNLERITPPWLGFEVTKAPPSMRAGALISYRLHLHGLPVRWQTRIAVWTPPHRFVDLQVSGPYALWLHTHEFESLNADETLLRDRVDYALPLGPLGALAHAAFVRRDVERIFDFRRAAVAEALGA